MRFRALQQQPCSAVKKIGVGSQVPPTTQDLLLRFMVIAHQYRPSPLAAQPGYVFSQGMNGAQSCAFWQAHLPIALPPAQAPPIQGEGPLPAALF